MADSLPSRSSKDQNCPNCGGRSFDASGGSDLYYECQLCEMPTEDFTAWYRSKWPDAYERWTAGRC